MSSPKDNKDLSSSTLETSETRNPDGTPLALPSIPTESDTTTFNLGESVKLDVLGPVVVNEDGSISRINNWSTLSDIEKDTYKRLVTKRNKQRLDKLKLKLEEQ